MSCRAPAPQWPKCAAERTTRRARGPKNRRSPATGCATRTNDLLRCTTTISTTASRGRSNAVCRSDRMGFPEGQPCVRFGNVNMGRAAVSCSGPAGRRPGCEGSADQVRGEGVGDSTGVTATQSRLCACASAGRPSPWQARDQRR